MTSAAHRRTAEPIVAVDLFCGVGGLTHGLIRSGIRVVAGVDLDASCRFPYEANNDAAFLERDVSDMSRVELDEMFENANTRLLAGCAPCQPYSTYSRSGRAPRREAKWEVVADFGRLVRAVQPELVTMENVPQLVDHPVFEDFLTQLSDYHVWWEVVECEEFGVPQTRRRLVLLGSKFGPIDLRKPKDIPRPTVRDAIAGLPRLRAGGQHGDDPLHTASSLSALNLQRIRASKPGGTWRDWPESLRARCHLKESGETYPAVYGRMEWDTAAPTITTQCFGYGNGRFGHPEQHRAISLREAAILQTFPDDYRFAERPEDIRFNRLGRLIGNAVPVRLAEYVGCALSTHVADAHAAGSSLLRRKN